MKRKIARRRFLASAAGVGAAAMFLPKVSARTYAANEKLNLALVGCGSRGGNLLDSFRQIGAAPAFFMPLVASPWTRIVEYPTRLNDFAAP